MLSIRTSVNCCRYWRRGSVSYFSLQNSENYRINHSSSYRSKPVRPSFIFVKIFSMKSESFLTLHRQQGKLLHSRAQECIKDPRNKKLLSIVIILVFFVHKTYSRSFIKFGFNHWCHMDYFNMSLLPFWALNMGSCCSLCKVRKLSDSIQNNLCSD